MRVFIFSICVSVFYALHLYMVYMGIAIPAFVNIIMVVLSIYFSLTVFVYFFLRFVMLFVKDKEQLSEALSKTNLTSYVINIIVVITLLGMYAIYSVSPIFFVVYGVCVMFILIDSKNINEYLPK